MKSPKLKVHIFELTVAIHGNVGRNLNNPMSECIWMVVITTRIVYVQLVIFCGDYFIVDFIIHISDWFHFSTLIEMRISEKFIDYYML